MVGKYPQTSKIVKRTPGEQTGEDLLHLDDGRRIRSDWNCPHDEVREEHINSGRRTGFHYPPSGD